MPKRTEKEERRWLRRHGVPTRTPRVRSARDKDDEATAARLLLASGFSSDELFRTLKECGWPSPTDKGDRSRHLAALNTRWEAIATRARQSSESLLLPEPMPARERGLLVRHRRAVRLPSNRERLDWLYTHALGRLRNYDVSPTAIDRLSDSDTAKRVLAKSLKAYRGVHDQSAREARRFLAVDEAGRCLALPGKAGRTK